MGQHFLGHDQADAFLLDVRRAALRVLAPPGAIWLTGPSRCQMPAATGRAQLSVDDLPGVGWAISKQLEDLGIRAVRDLRQRSCEELQSVLGQKVGENLYHFARGKDDRPLVSVQPRKTVGAEVNWGIRFEEESQVHKFLNDLAAEVARRLQEAGAAGRTITLKVRHGGCSGAGVASS